MSQKNLAEIYALLPEVHQKNSLLQALEQMFAYGEWGSLDEMIPALLNIQTGIRFRGQIVSLGVRVSARLKNYDLAFERYGLFLELKDNSEIEQLRAEALMQLAIQLLPNETDKLYHLWNSSFSTNMTAYAQEIWAKTGVLIAKTFLKNNDEEMAKAVKKIMQENLSENIWHRFSHKLTG